MIESLVAPAVSGGGGYRGLLHSGQLRDEPYPPAAAAAAPLKLWCSLGGRILPRDLDKSLTYSGGDSRLFTVDRRVSLAELTSKISNTFHCDGPFVLKYQLPNEDLDSLISVITDEDLESMIEEYDRIPDPPHAGRPSGPASVGGGFNRPGRLRLFLFPTKTASAPVSAIGSLLGDSKSETWFVDAFNSASSVLGTDGIARGRSADAVSVDSLLDLADDTSIRCLVGSAYGGDGGGGVVASKSEQFVLPRPDSFGKLSRQGQEVQSVPDSPLLDHSSSFGSDCSAPPLSNLPPIRPEQFSPAHRMAGLEDHFARSYLSPHTTASAVAGGSDDGLEEIYLQPSNGGRKQPPSSIFLPNSPTSTSISSTENPGRAFSSDDNKSDHGGTKKPQVATPSPINAGIPDFISRPAYSHGNTDLQKALPVSLNPGLQILQHASNSSECCPSHAEGFQKEQQQQAPQRHPNQQQQQQQQFIPAVMHYIHGPATGAVYQMPTYYQVVARPFQQLQQAHPHGQQIPIYFMQVPQTPYNMETLQLKAANPSSMTSEGMTGFPVPQANSNTELPKSSYGVVVAAPSHAGLQPQLIPLVSEQSLSYAGIGYQFVSQQHLAQSPATMPNYGHQYAADPAQAQMYYSQATLPLVSASQYQTVSSTPQYQTVCSKGVSIADIRPTTT